MEQKENTPDFIAKFWIELGELKIIPGDKFYISNGELWHRRDDRTVEGRFTSYRVNMGNIKNNGETLTPEKAIEYLKNIPSVPDKPHFRLK